MSVCALSRHFQLFPCVGLNELYTISVFKEYFARRRKETPLRTLAAAFRALREKASAGLMFAAGSTAAILAIAWTALWTYGLYYIILQTAVVAFGLRLFAITRMKASPLRRGIALGCSVLGAAALIPYSV